jgi:methanogenic corrinoid protein MtbC1
MLKWLVARQNEGVSISRAVEMWKGQKIKELFPALPASQPSDTEIEGLRRRWLAACMAFDDPYANHILDQGFSIASPEVVCTEVILKGLQEIGMRWYSGTATVQQEHFTSAIATRRINSLFTASPTPTKMERLLVICPPGEEHDLVLMVASCLLRRAGWDVIYLGANVPLADLDATLQSAQPRLVISSAQTLYAASALRRLSEYLLSKGVPLAYGGSFFPQSRNSPQSISGNYLGDDLSLLPQAVERQLKDHRQTPAASPLPAAYAQALAKFLQNEGLIIHYLTAKAQEQMPEPDHLEAAVYHLTHMLPAALELGDLDALTPSLAWVKGLLVNRGIPDAAVNGFLSIFDQAIERYLGAQGALIRNWMAMQGVQQGSTGIPESIE